MNIDEELSCLLPSSNVIIHGHKSNITYLFQKPPLLENKISHWL